MCVWRKGLGRGKLESSRWVTWMKGLGWWEAGFCARVCNRVKKWCSSVCHLCLCLEALHARWTGTMSPPPPPSLSPSSVCLSVPLVSPPSTVFFVDSALVFFLLLLPSFSLFIKANMKPLVGLHILYIFCICNVKILGSVWHFGWGSEYLKL